MCGSWPRAGPSERDPRSSARSPEAEASQRHAELTEKLNDARWRYHVLDAPTISDGEFDTMMRELNQIEDAFPVLRTPDSPTQQVGGPPSTTFAAVEHLQRLMSLDNAFSREELDRWHARAVRELGEQRWTSRATSASSRWTAWRSTWSTRADGWSGRPPAETAGSARTSPRTSGPSVSSRTGSAGGDAPDVLEVRGEVFFAVADFAALNESLVTTSPESSTASALPRR